MMVLIGVLDFFQGLMAIIRYDYYVGTPKQIIVFDLTAWVGPCSSGVGVSNSAADLDATLRIDVSRPARWLRDHARDRSTHQPERPATPFTMPDYHVATRSQADQRDAASETSATEVRRDIQRSSNYVLSVVLYAVALFRRHEHRIGSRRQRWVWTVTGCLISVEIPPGQGPARTGPGHHVEARKSLPAHPRRLVRHPRGFRSGDCSRDLSDAATACAGAQWTHGGANGQIGRPASPGDQRAGNPVPGDPVGHH